jgi:predicted nuclease with TOPRIM domain
MKKYNLKNAIDVQKKYNDLKQERKDLRIKLDNFQKNFEQAHNRKIRYTKDIGPVNHDFKRYKDLKSELTKIELIISSNAR